MDSKTPNIPGFEWRLLRIDGQRVLIDTELNVAGWIRRKALNRFEHANLASIRSKYLMGMKREVFMGSSVGFEPSSPDGYEGVQPEGCEAKWLDGFEVLCADGVEARVLLVDSK